MATVQLISDNPSLSSANDESDPRDPERLSVYLNMQGHPRIVRLKLPTGVLQTGEGREWVLLRVPIEELLLRLARWSDHSFPNHKRLSTTLAGIDAGEVMDVPVMIHHNVGHVFESGGHLTLMLAELGASSVPVVARTVRGPTRPARRSIRVLVRRFVKDIRAMFDE